MATSPIGTMALRVDLDTSGFNRGAAGLQRQMKLVTKSTMAQLSAFDKMDDSIEKNRVIQTTLYNELF